jgi:hypothetical protein
MAIVTYDTYVPELQPYVPGCPRPTIINALQRTGWAFFTGSLAYRLWVPAFDLTISTTSYVIPGLPTETEVTQITTMYSQGVPVNEVTHEQFFALDPEWPSKTGTNPQWFTALTDISTFNIIPIPEATVADAFNLQVALAPTLTATGVEQAFFEQWKDGLIDGALSRLMEMPGKTWTDVKGAATRQARYIAEMAQARAQANKGHIRRDLTVQMRRWV